MKVYSMGEFRQRLSQALDVALDGKPAVVMDYKRPVAVLISLAEYERLTNSKLVFSVSEPWPAGAYFAEVEP
jgi:prevent-host-death family protein